MPKAYFYLVYPEKRWVSEDQILIWGADAVENGDIENVPDGHVLDALAALEDIGVLTYGGSVGVIEDEDHAPSQ